MNIVLIEDPIYSVDSLKKSVKSKFPVTSQISVTKGNFYEKLKLSKTTPLLTEGWAIITSSSLDIKQCALLCSDSRNLIIMDVKPRNKHEAIVVLSGMGIEFSVVDNVHVSKPRLISYTRDKLNISEKDAITLCNRCNNYLPYVNESVSLLESLGKEITRSDILKYSNKRTSFNIQSLLLHLIGYKRANTDEVACFIYDFRYALTYIKRSLLKYLEDSIEIYILMENGLLGADNYKDFKFPRKLEMSEYLLKRLIIDIHPVVPLEMLILVKVSIQKINKTYELLNII